MAVLASMAQPTPPGHGALSLAAGGGPSLVPLATLPGYVFHLNRELSRAHPDARIVHAAIATDPALTLQVLCLANAYLPTGFPPIFGLGQAIATVGMYELRALVMNMPVLEYTNAPANLLDVQLFWQRSLFVAMMSAHLAEAGRLVAPEQAYSAGLLYRIGDLVHLMRAQNKWSDDWALGAIPSGDDVTTITHRIVLASRLPKELVQSCHAHPESLPPDPLTRVVLAAYNICDEHRLNRDGLVQGLNLDLKTETGLLLERFGIAGDGLCVKSITECATAILSNLEFTSMGLLHAAELHA